MNATNIPYDLTNISNVNSTVDFISEVNHLTGDVFMVGVLGVTTFVTYMALLKYGGREAIIVSLFINTFAALVFFILGWIAMPWLILFVIALGLTVSFLFSSES